MNQTHEVSSPTLRNKLKHLLSEHSSKEVYRTLMEVFREDFTFYTELFSKGQVSQPQKQAEPQIPLTQPLAQQQQPQPHEPLKKVKGDIRIRVVKRVEEPPVETTTSQPLNVDTLPDVPQEELPAQSEKERKARIKREQAAAELIKSQELSAQGITPESLLTKENLNTWVNTQSLSFTQIARDHVGIDAEKISDVAKKFGIQSNIAKKRAQIFAAKKRNA
jgi:hypothetical protein